MLVLHLSSVAVLQRHLLANMENMLAGHKLYFSLQNYLHKRRYYHQIAALSKRIILLRERKEKRATVAEAIIIIAETLLSKTG